jgi:hypothetical protein
MVAINTFFDIKSRARRFLVDLLYRGLTPTEKYLGVGGLRVVDVAALVSAG